MLRYEFHHVHVVSRDQQKTAEFFEKMFGAKTLCTLTIKEGKNVVDIDLHGTQIKLMAEGPELPTSDPGFRGTLEHICLRTDNIEAAAEELRASGARQLREIVPAEPHHKHDVVYFLIPGDVTVELNDAKVR
ncbi:hypothetical protein ES703_30053 [subsurface metagenome]